MTARRGNEHPKGNIARADAPAGLITLLVILCWAALLVPSPVAADHPPPEEILDTAKFDQRLNTRVPLDLAFGDEAGKQVTLGSYLGARPVILALVYYECPNLCSTVLEDLVETLNEIRFTLGHQYDVVTVSIDPRETPAQAAKMKKTLLGHYNRATIAGEAGWHALTGAPAAVERLASTVGFRYAWDEQLQQYAHPSGLVVLTPEGRISRYFYGLVYSPGDLRLGLVEASANKIGSPVDQVLLRCYRYDPTSGSYTLAIMDTVRLAGAATIFLIGTFLVVNFARERRQQIRGLGDRVIRPTD